LIQASSNAWKPHGHRHDDHDGCDVKSGDENDEVSDLDFDSDLNFDDDGDAGGSFFLLSRMLCQAHQV
jgi:hypothetical protein